MGSLWKVLTRRKPLLDPGASSGTGLARVLNTCDLAALGVGSTLGVGVYVLASAVARNAAGPGVVVSFLLAAVASTFAGLCYAEFGARVPRAGSAYTYSYVSIGEFVAFVIGWNLILEYVIGAASVVRGLSMYLDSMMNDTMKNVFISFAPMNVSILSPYFDFFAFVTSLILAVILAVGVKESSYMNSVFTLVNIAVILFVIIVGSIKADPANWKIRPEDIPVGVDGGKGGFLPFGIAGVLKGAATCFYGFVGFDCIATTGEEVKKPQRSIPVAIILSLMIVFLSYFGISTVLTMMIPYYQQNKDAPIPYAFMSVGWPVAEWIVTIGGVFGLCASLFGSMFPLPRIIYAMATDGLLFRFLGMVNSRLHTPLVATLLAGVLTGVMAGAFELSHLVNMMSIGTLLAYTIVAACVVLLRYSGGMGEDGYMLLVTYCENDDADDGSQPRDAVTFSNNDSDEDQGTLMNTNLKKVDDEKGKSNKFSAVAMQLFNFYRVKSPTSLTSNMVAVEVSLFCVLCVVTSQSVIQLMYHLASGNAAAIALIAVEVFIMCVIIISIALQPKSPKHLPFTVPFVPLLPALSIFINVYLMMMLDALTWIRFAVWMAVGVVFYLMFGWWNSEEKRNGRQDASGHPPKPTAGHINAGYESSETSCDPEATPEASEKTDKSAYVDRKTCVTPHSDSNHVTASANDSVVKENHKESQVNDVLLGSSEKPENGVLFVNETKRNLKQNVRVFGGDSVRSYKSVRDGAENSVKGSVPVVCPSASVPSVCACLGSCTCENGPLKHIQPNNENSITVIPGLQVSQGNGSKCSEDKNLYPNVIVLPFGTEMMGDDHSLNETSDHDDSRDSPDSEEYCTPETDELEDSTGGNTIYTSDEKLQCESDEKINKESVSTEPLDLEKSEFVGKCPAHVESDVKKVSELIGQNTTHDDTNLKKENEMPLVPAQKDRALSQGTIRSSSFTEKLNNLLKKQHNSKTEQLQANNYARKRSWEASRTEPNHRDNNLHEKLKKKPSIDSRHVENSLGIKDRLELLLSQRLVGTIPRLNPDSGNKNFATLPPIKSYENEVINPRLRALDEQDGSSLQVKSNEKYEREIATKETENTKFTETEPYTKDELRAKLEDIFSRKQRPSLKTRPQNTETKITSSVTAETAGKHKLLMEELISTTEKEVSVNTNDIDRAETFVTSNHKGEEQIDSEKNDVSFQNHVKTTDEHLEDSDNSEIFFDALSNSDVDSDKR